MQEKSGDNSYLFKPAQFLGPPTVFPPAAPGKLPISVQFIIPGFKLDAKDKEAIELVTRKCVPDLCAVDSRLVSETTTKQKGTLFTIAFYGTPVVSGSEHPDGEQVFFQSRFLVERFLGLLSFFAGVKLTATHIQPTTMNNGQYSQMLRPIRRTNVPDTQLNFPSNLKTISLTDDTFSALSWLRRGLAERDPIETFSAFTVCIQIIARQIIKGESTDIICPNCAKILGTREPSITSLVRELIILKLGASKQLFERIWKVRNAVTAHGNLTVTPEVILDLTELKFEVAKLAYEAVKLSLGMPLELPPSPSQAFFVTDAFMYVD